MDKLMSVNEFIEKLMEISHRERDKPIVIGQEITGFDYIDCSDGTVIVLEPQEVEESDADKWSYIISTPDHKKIRDSIIKVMDEYMKERKGKKVRVEITMTEE